jgi:hypothetical protein
MHIRTFVDIKYFYYLRLRNSLLLLCRVFLGTRYIRKGNVTRIVIFCNCGDALFYVNLTASITWNHLVVIRKLINQNFAVLFDAYSNWREFKLFIK